MWSGVNREVTYFTRTTRSYFRFAPPPFLPGQDGFKQFPTPGTEGLDLSPGLPGGGMVTGKIEPCINLVFWHLSPKFFKRPMPLYRKNKYIPKNAIIRVLYLIKIAIFNLPTTSNHPCDELFANANF